ncbi:5-oxoprolinase subunit PxpA [Burkholderia stagnalis]|uniref:5-oxoprolinase subunit PxpA n=1 Tax=Burkholderia stagnalis TaxID=1503054 RepID=UPI000F5B979F|nr:5-oxoprolinase subunit PxpA [Burkholderia stagnalis]RQQ01043.1 LamB/YcsF family protein [Burkholderia stagnalis]RQY68739.1 LamB/YcsF family protein [Burkholderia stagnalis]
MRVIDLNVDLGEGCANDVELLAYATSINVACGWHAGDATTMMCTCAAALEKSIRIGAHPSYPDRENFGRKSLKLPVREIYAGVLYQIGSLNGILKAMGGRMSHVKPHGALYNDAERDGETAEAIVAAVRDIDPTLEVYGLAGGQLVRLARRYGIAARDEAFADRGYSSSGHLLPRGAPAAMIEDVGEAVSRVKELAMNGRVTADDGRWLEIPVETICLHGDGPHAVIFAKRIKSVLDSLRISSR